MCPKEAGEPLKKKRKTTPLTCSDEDSRHSSDSKRDESCGRVSDACPLETRDEREAEDTASDGSTARKVARTPSALTAKKPSGIILRGGRIRLPDKLMEYLNKGVAPDVLYWQDGGESFSFDTNTAQEDLLDKYFNGSKLTSFVRSLNRWGFKRIFHALLPKSVLSYEHPLFRQDNADLVKEMKMVNSNEAAHGGGSPRSSPAIAPAHIPATRGPVASDGNNAASVPPFGATNSGTGTALVVPLGVPSEVSSFLAPCSNALLPPPPAIPAHQQATAETLLRSLLNSQQQQQQNHPSSFLNQTVDAATLASILQQEQQQSQPTIAQLLQAALQNQPLSQVPGEAQRAVDQARLQQVLQHTQAQAHLQQVLQQAQAQTQSNSLLQALLQPQQAAQPQQHASSQLLQAQLQAMLQSNNAVNQPQLLQAQAPPAAPSTAQAQIQALLALQQQQPPQQQPPQQALQGNALLQALFQQGEQARLASSNQ